MLPPTDILEATRRRYEETKEAQNLNKALIVEGRRSDADTPEQRMKRRRRLLRAPLVKEAVESSTGGGFESAEVLPAGVYERMIGRDNFLGVAFLTVGLRAARTVLCIRIWDGSSGTGFMVSPDLLITNHHVLPAKAQAQGSKAVFNFERDENNKLLPTYSFDLDPDRFFLNNEELDYALVAVKPHSYPVDGLGAVPLARFGYNRLSAEEGKVQEAETVNIIQHPSGAVKQLALQDNDITKRLENFVQYFTDTMPGSSGAPVFNNQWEVIALHHSGVPAVFESGPNKGKYMTADGSVWQEWMGDDKIKWIANEGVRVSRIMASLQAQIGAMPPEQQALAQAMLKAIPQGEPAGPTSDSVVAPGPPSSGSEGKDTGLSEQREDLSQAEHHNIREDNVTDGANDGIRVARTTDGSLQVTIPLTITVRLGGSVTEITTTAVTPVPGAPPVPEDPQELRSLLADAGAFHDRAYIPEGDAAASAQYYQGIDPNANPEALFETLRDLLTDTHQKKLPYSPASQLYPWVDRQPNGGIRSVYTGQDFDVPALIRESFRAEEALRLREEALRRQESLPTLERAQLLDVFEKQLTFNCEHVVPQSWFGKQLPMRGDLHHLFACESKCNSFRGNTPYFDFPDFEEKVIQGCGRNDGDKFEPKQGKAEAARATLYFLLRYPGQVSPGEMPRDRLAFLIAWAKSTLPSDYEKHRNAAIFAVQGNRNPLIDHPDWIDRIAFDKGIF